MSGPRSGTSSGAAEGGEEALVVGEDAGDVRRLWGRVPDVELERAAEQDPVGTREHVSGAASVGVTDVRLRLQDGELAAHRLELGVAEQLPAAEAGAVEYQRFGQGGDVGRGRKAPHLDLATG